MSAEFPVVVERFIFFMAQSSTRYSALSFDDLVRPRQHIGWNGEADLLGGWQIAGFGAPPLKHRAEGEWAVGR